MTLPHHYVLLTEAPLCDAYSTTGQDYPGSLRNYQSPAHSPPIQIDSPSQSDAGQSLPSPLNPG